MCNPVYTNNEEIDEINFESTYHEVLSLGHVQTYSSEWEPVSTKPIFYMNTEAAPLGSMSRTRIQS